nr:hypothetical protein [Arcanobacterium phocae]
MVVGEVGKSVAGSFDAFDEVVHGFGDRVRWAGVVVGQDLVIPVFECSAKLLDFLGHEVLASVVDEFIKHGLSGGDVGCRNFVGVSLTR